jgi:uncharacterized protein
MFKIFDVEEGRFGKRITSSEEIKKDAVITRFTGEPMTFEESKKMGETESFALQIDNHLYIYLDEPVRFFNHSCEPNCGLRPDLKLIALQDIPEGEELFFDYSTTMLERYWTMPCDCQKQTCRKIVQDFDFLPPETQQKYLKLNVVQDFIVKALMGK